MKRKREKASGKSKNKKEITVEYIVKTIYMWEVNTKTVYYSLLISLYCRKATKSVFKCFKDIRNVQRKHKLFCVLRIS